MRRQGKKSGAGRGNKWRERSKRRTRPGEEVEDKFKKRLRR